MKATLVLSNSGRFYLEVDGNIIEKNLSTSNCYEIFLFEKSNRIEVEVLSEFDFNGMAWEECMKLDSNGCVTLIKA
jgi:hypothetical protein